MTMEGAQARGSRGLGRGLSALLGDDAEPAPRGDVVRTRMIPIAFLKANPLQPRRHFDEEELAGLAASIAEKGVLQPILVRPTERQDSFEIIAGERRWRAAQRAKLHDVPVVVREFSDAESLEIAIIENIQRSNLNPVEEAAGYHELIGRFAYTQEQLARVIGKSRSHIANLLRLLKLSPRIQGFLAEGKLSAGHARMLVTAKDPEALADQIIAQGLNVREVEKKAKQARDPKAPAGKDTDTKSLERALSTALGLTVSIEHHGQKGGALMIRYRTLEQLEQVIRRLQPD